MKNHGVGPYLVHCYMYYVLDHPVIEDAAFDRLCKHLLDHWDEIEHPHKHLVSKDDLRAGTGYSIPIHHYPNIVKSIGDQLRLKGLNYFKEMKHGD